jgi:EAL domain-containing protein (putative c-di-GMP-specific phosphodiesterase class I)
MIGPARFVPALEAAGLADGLFYAMARAVLADMVRWREQGLALKVAINMSMATALNLDMPERLQLLVDEAGLQASDLIIEITESQLMVQRSLAMETLTRLSLMGFVLSIDDFGTGYSSLVQLIDLPFRELKIDGSFVQRARTERKAEAILRIAILIGVNLAMEVVAEGVETAEQLEFLRGCGGTIVQGYQVARPMPFLACSEFLQRKEPASAT